MFMNFICFTNLCHWVVALSKNKRVFPSFPRYSIDRVFRPRKLDRAHPRELLECAFDIITPVTNSLLPDAESIYTISEIVQEFPALQVLPLWYHIWNNFNVSVCSAALPCFTSRQDILLTGSNAVISTRVVCFLSPLNVPLACLTYQTVEEVWQIYTMFIIYTLNQFGTAHFTSSPPSLQNPFPVHTSQCCQFWPACLLNPINPNSTLVRGPPSHPMQCESFCIIWNVI